MFDSKINRRGFLKAGSGVALGLALGDNLWAAGKPLEQVRIGIVGVGVRGTEFVNILLNLKGNVIKAIGDISEGNAKRAQKLVKDAGFPEPALYCRGEKDYERMCENEDLDLVIAAVPVDWHVPVCVSAMKNGKHSATEVHATYDLDECWELVEAAEKYNKQCGLLENYCYFYNVLMILKWRGRVCWVIWCIVRRGISMMSVTFVLAVMVRFCGVPRIC